MMNKLYRKVYLNEGKLQGKFYVCAVRGRHITRVFRQAQKEQDHSQALLKRLDALRAAKANSESE